MTRCPNCGRAELRVINTRNYTEHVVRRRECKECGRRYTTYEVSKAEYKDLKSLLSRHADH